MHTSDQRPVVSVTGQRPQHLRPGEQQYIEAEIPRVIARLASQGVQVLCSGMALGVDQWAALAALNEGMALEAHLPFPAEQQGKFWSGTDRAVHAALIKQAERTVFYGDGTQKFDLIPAYHRRNQGLVNRVMHAPSGLFIAATNGKGSGGTWDCLHRIAATDRSTILIHAKAATTTLLTPDRLAVVLQLDPDRIAEHRKAAA